MKQIEIIVTRHEKKDPNAPKKEHPGDAIDREQTGLSQEGFQDAYLLGQKELAGKGINQVYVVTSDFLRTQQTAQKILEGAGFDVEKDLRGDQSRARFMSDSRMGLGGTDWSNESFPPFGNDQEVLNTYVNHLITNHYLLPEGVPRDNPDKLPIMAARGSAIYEGIANGIADLSTRLSPEQRGALLVVTHAPIIDAFAARATSNLQLEETEGSVYVVTFRDGPVEAHNQGQYIKGSVSASGLEGVAELQIKGKYCQTSRSKFREEAGLLRELAHTGSQKKK